MHAKIADILVAPALQWGQKVFARELFCGGTIDSLAIGIDPMDELVGPTIEDCGDHLHVINVVPGARVEVYRNGIFFASGRSGSLGTTSTATEVRILLAAPLLRRRAEGAPNFMRHRVGVRQRAGDTGRPGKEPPRNCAGRAKQALGGRARLLAYGSR